MVGRIREIVFDDGVDVDGIAEVAASTDYVDDKFTTQGALIIDPHGWTEYDDTYMTRSWVGNTFTLTQVGTSTPYYCKGELKYLTGNKSITITPTAGDHYIALNCTTEELEDLGATFPIAQVLSTHILAEICYANGTAVTFFANERHTTKFLKRDWIYKHLSFSTQYRTGIQPSITAIDESGDLDTHNQFSVTAGTLSDEDIDFTVAAILAAAIKNVWYYNGTIWVKDTGLAGSGVLNTGTGRAAYNNIATGLVECTNNYHVLTHIFAANNGEILCIVGNAQYQLLANARIAASEEIGTLLDTGLPFPEFRAIATYISKTSDGYASAAKSKIVSVDTGVPFIDWRETALNPVAGASASNHQSLSGLQGGQAGEYYHLTAAQYGNVTNNIFPAGAASNTQNKINLPSATTAQWEALTATETLLGWDSTKKKPIVGDGSVFKPIGGGLVPTPIDKDFASALESGKHYVYNGAGMSGDVTLNMPAVAAESNIKVTVYNIPSGYKLILAANGSEKFRKNDTEYSTVEFVATEIEQSAEFVSNNTQWIVDDGSNALGTVWSGSHGITGNLGVGTTSPTQKLEIYQSAPSANLIGVYLNTDSPSGYSQKIVWNDNWTSGAGQRAAIYGYAYTGANKGQLRFQTGNGTTLVDRMTIDEQGRVGIGTVTPGTTLDIIGGARATSGYTLSENSTNQGGLYSYSDVVGSGTNYSPTIFSESSVYIAPGGSVSNATAFLSDGRIFNGATYNNTTATAANMVVDSGGQFLRSTSSLKYKKNVVDYDKGLEAVMALRPVYFESKNESEDGIRYAGFIAEEVHAQGMDEFVQYKEGQPDALAYSNMTALLTKAIQEQQKQIEELKAEIAAMRGV